MCPKCCGCEVRMVPLLLWLQSFPDQYQPDLMTTRMSGYIRWGHMRTIAMGWLSSCALAVTYPLLT